MYRTFEGLLPLRFLPLSLPPNLILKLLLLLSAHWVVVFRQKHRDLQFLQRKLFYNASEKDTETHC